ncbi:histone-lysine N-methyltransferase SETD1 [Ceratobasidium sp. AG-Ba]|nr:histone-lysine N-methyltransferase SETD1 [Ceratobasidium sp. AG-Ba]
MSWNMKTATSYAGETVHPPDRRYTTDQQTVNGTTVADPRRHFGSKPTPSASAGSAPDDHRSLWPPPRDPGLRDYKVIYDPFTSGGRRTGDNGKEFLYRYNGEVGPGEEPIRVRDPRRDLSERNREGRGKAKPRSTFYLLHYEYDDNSCGPPPPPPPRGICVSGLSPLTAAGQVRRHFSSYGTIEEFISQVDRATGAPLGLFWIKFADEDEQGQRAANQAVVRENGRRIGNGNEARLATVELDGEGQLCRDKFNEEMEARRKAWEESRRHGSSSLPSKAAVSSSSPLNQPTPIVPPSPASLPAFPGLPNRPQPPSKGTGYRPAPVPPQDRPDKSPLATSMRPPGPPPSKGRATPVTASSSASPLSRNGSLRPNSHLPVNPSPLHASSPLPNASPKPPTTIEKPKASVAETPPVDEEENHRDTLRLLALNGNDHIKIEKSSLPDESKAVELEIRRFFGAYKVDRVLKDIHGWYISFDVSSDARRALSALGDKTIAGRPVVLAVHPAPSIATLATTTSRPRGQGQNGKEWTEIEFIQEARKIIMRDLMGVFTRDLRERVARPKAWKLVDEALATHAATEEKEAEDVPVPETNTTPAPSEISVSTPKGLKGLSFKRQHQNVKVDINIFNRLTPQNRINLLNILNKKNSTNETAPITLPIPPPPTSPVPVSPPKPKTAAAILVQEEPSTESDEAVNVDRFERSLKRRKVALDRPSLHNKRQRVRRKVEFSESERSEVDEPASSKARQPNGAPHPPPSSSNKRKPSRPKRRDEPAVKVKDEPVVTPARSLSPISVPPKEEEVVTPTPPAVHDLPVPDGLEVPDPYAQQWVGDEEDLYYMQLLLGKDRGIELPSSAVERPAEEDTSNYPPGLRKHLTGSARTEGYYKIPEAAKSLYLPQRNRAIVDVSTTAASGATSSRSNRANSRRLQQGKATDTSDVLKFNQLRTRKKQLTFSRSPIHDWGLYAAEAIPAGDMVIEYVGEVIRQQVADKREKYYEKTGIGSSYLFRVDDDSVVDATKKGNLGRLINHCCAPNCTAKIITINGEKKIVIYAKTNIDVGDEITYDYHFPLEDQKVGTYNIRFVIEHSSDRGGGGGSDNWELGQVLIIDQHPPRKLKMSPVGLAILAHLPGLTALGSHEVILKAVYSRSKSSASSLSDLAKDKLSLSHDVSVYSDDSEGLDALLARSDIQAVIVVLPINQQPDIVLRALAAGKNVLSEKPVAKDVKTGLALIEKWETEFKPKGLIWRVAENFEAEPAYAEAGRRIKAGVIGEVRSFNYSILNSTDKSSQWYKTPWRTVPEYQGGFVLDAGVHFAAALRTILPFSLETSTLSGFASLTREYLAPVDTVQVVIQADRSAGAHPPHGVFELTFAAPAGLSRNLLTVIGTEGYLTLTNVSKTPDEKDLRLANAAPFAKKGPSGSLNVTYIRTTIKKGEDGSNVEEYDTIGSGVATEIDSFVKALNGQDDGKGNPRGALQDVAIIQAALQSGGKPVDVKRLVSTGEV